MHASTFDRPKPMPGGTIRTLTVSLVGAAALVTGLVLIRQQQKDVPAETEPVRLKDVPAGETVPGTISLERLRELGY